MGKRVVIDTDPGVDDALALLLALRSPELKVEAITTVAGNVGVELATKNACLVLNLIKPVPRPILAVGASQPVRKRPVTSQSVHGSDGLGELHRFRNSNGTRRYPEPELPPDLPDGTEVLLDRLKRYPDEITLITLGPLTNLANALLADKHRLNRLQEVIVMGGAIQVPGNITPAAEFNIFVDPDAARQVFTSGLPITLVPLDVTEKVLLRPADIETLRGSMEEPLGTFLADTTSNVLDYMEQVRGMRAFALHDPLAVAVAIDPSLVETSLLYVDVAACGGITDGMTVADLRRIRDDVKYPPNLHVALKVDAARFLAFFQERLCQKSS